jgi:hypothetical protein
MLGIVRIQPPTGSPYMEPPVVKRMARQLPAQAEGSATGLGIVRVESLGQEGFPCLQGPPDSPVRDVFLFLALPLLAIGAVYLGDRARDKHRRRSYPTRPTYPTRRRDSYDLWA